MAAKLNKTGETVSSYVLRFNNRRERLQFELTGAENP
jgi:hypothetical protein